MKAAVLYKARDIRIEDIEKCIPEPSEALFKVDTVGICGSDVHYYKNGGIADRIIKKPHITPTQTGVLAALKFDFILIFIA